MASIHLENVEKAFGAFVGVRDMNLEIADEEFLVLLGPSGCGKTTTMRMIAGLEQPTAGRDRHRRRGGHRRRRPRPRRRDGVPGLCALPEHDRLREHPLSRSACAACRGTSRTRLIRRAAEMVELGALLDRKPGALSGGQRQRAALARAIVREPQVFLMDEPLSNLDAKLRASMRVQIKHLQRQLRITTVYVTHDQIEAMTLADRIVIMDKGAIQQVGTPDEIYSNPANTFVAGFIGSPPMNLIAGEASGGRFRSPGIEAAAPPQLRGRVILGVRPEDCRVAESGELTGEVYGVEPTGDATYLTVSTSGQKVEVKALREFRAALEFPGHDRLRSEPALLLRRRQRGPGARRGVIAACAALTKSYLRFATSQRRR